MSIRIYFLDFRESSRSAGGAVVPGRIIRFRQSLVDQIFGTTVTRQGTEYELQNEDRITFLIHGFNFDREDGRVALSRLAKDLPSVHEDAIVIVLWPGDSSVVALRHLCYVWRKHDANDAAHEMARFCRRRIRASTVLSFASHSLGARVVMETVKRLSPSYPVDQICLMAAAIDDDTLADSDEFRTAVHHANRVAVLSSKMDRVLGWAYQPGQHASFAPISHVVSRNALGYHGPRGAREYLFWSETVPTNVYHTQIPKSRNAGHGDYIRAHGRANRQHRSAAGFADQVLRGDPGPVY